VGAGALALIVMLLEPPTALAGGVKPGLSWKPPADPPEKVDGEVAATGLKLGRAVPPWKLAGVTFAEVAVPMFAGAG
jgi:hypothetical protein